jgi:hypothetical protein
LNALQEGGWLTLASLCDVDLEQPEQRLLGAVGDRWRRAMKRLTLPPCPKCEGPYSWKALTGATASKTPTQRRRLGAHPNRRGYEVGD